MNNIQRWITFYVLINGTFKWRFLFVFVRASALIRNLKRDSEQIHFIYGLYNDAVRSSERRPLALDGKMIKRTGNGMKEGTHGLIWSTVSECFSGGGGRPWETSVMMTSALPDIRTLNLPNTRQLR
jgi:hypothetical protein